MVGQPLCVQMFKSVVVDAPRGLPCMIFLRRCTKVVMNLKQTEADRQKNLNFLSELDFETRRILEVSLVGRESQCGLQLSCEFFWTNYFVCATERKFRRHQCLCLDHSDLLFIVSLLSSSSARREYCKSYVSVHDTWRGIQQ